MENVDIAAGASSFLEGKRNMLAGTKAKHNVKNQRYHEAWRNRVMTACDDSAGS